jgi:hypothetical protein
MEERHDAEQYFFDAATLDHLADFLSAFENPCCLCTPLLGKALVKRGRRVRILDVDERFASLPGFARYDIERPRWLGEPFDVIVCDPPFYNVSLSQLFAAVRTLARYDLAQPLLIAFLSRRSASVLRAFAPFGLVPTGYHPGYETVETCERNEIELYGNLGTAAHEKLCGGGERP